jgi:hypothetical protein
MRVSQSRSRPAESNDNPHSESLSRTLKYRPQPPIEPVADLLAALRDVTGLVHWYSREHRHSAIWFVTPEQLHCGSDRELLANRQAIFRRARLAYPSRWSKQTRNLYRYRSSQSGSQTKQSAGNSPVSPSTSPRHATTSLITAAIQQVPQAKLAFWNSSAHCR